jgi:cysteine desulfurase
MPTLDAQSLPQSNSPILFWPPGAFPVDSRRPVNSIYFDYNATTPLDPAVREAMLPFLGEIFGNPSSVHHIGRRARALVDDARDRIAALWRCKPSEVVFTSGGTESNNLAIFGAARLLKSKGSHLIVSSIEHHAVLDCFKYLEAKDGFTVTRLPVGPEGIVDPADLKKALRPDTILVSVMAANNETGAIQPVAELGAICRAAGVLFHTDAAQWFGKEPFSSIHQFNADLVAICAHKFHGPKGSGALFIRSPLLPDPIHFGGGQENDRRAGTENVASIIGLAEALALFSTPPVFSSQVLRPLTQELAAAAASIEGVELRGSQTFRLSNTFCFTVEGSDSIALLGGLDLEGVCASSGSACSAGSVEPSHVILALGGDPKLANSLVRFSLGRSSTQEEVSRVASLLPSVINRARSA